MPASSVERKRGGTRPAVRGYVDTTPQQLPSDKKPFHLLSPRGQWHRVNRAHPRAISDAQNKLVRREAIEAYRARCICCGETEREFLTIDHSKGAKHEMYGRLYPGLPRTGFQFYWRLQKLGFPRRGFRLLCWNCNNAIGRYGNHRFESCPHKRKAAGDGLG